MGWARSINTFVGDSINDESQNVCLRVERGNEKDIFMARLISKKRFFLNVARLFNT